MSNVWTPFLKGELIYHQRLTPSSRTLLSLLIDGRVVQEEDSK